MDLPSVAQETENGLASPRDICTHLKSRGSSSPTPVSNFKSRLRSRQTSKIEGDT